MTYDLVDATGERYSGEAVDIVQQLHKGSFTQCGSDSLFMGEMSRRVEMMFGRRIRKNTAENFIEDLIAVRYLIAVE